MTTTFFLTPPLPLAFGVLLLCSGCQSSLPGAVVTSVDSRLAPVEHGFVRVSQPPSNAVFPPGKQHVWVSQDPAPLVYVRVSMGQVPKSASNQLRPASGMRAPVPTGVRSTSDVSSSPPVIVHFQFDRSDLSPQARSQLKAFAESLSGRSDYTVIVDAYTDAVGSDSYNLDLSRRRASSVQSFLQTRGVSASLVSLSAHGESDPVGSNQSAAGRAANRRATVQEAR